MKKLNVLWVEDISGYAESLKFNIESDITSLGFNFNIDSHLNGDHVAITVRDLQPDLILVDYNLPGIDTNGDYIIREIRFQNNNTPIIFYSSAMDDSVRSLVSGYPNIFSTHRDDLGSEILRVLQNHNF